MNHAAYTALDVTQSDAVTTVSMNHPPLKLLDDVLMPQLKRFVREVTSDASTRVIVFESALPEFFAAHGDINYVSGSNPTGMPHSASTTPLRPARIRQAMNDGLQTPEHDREFEAFFDRYGPHGRARRIDAVA